MKMILKRMILLLPLLLLLVFTSAKAAVVHIEDMEYYQDAVFSEIKSADDYAAGLTTDGRLFVVGENNYGRLGTGDTTNRYFPTDITGNFNLLESEYITRFDTGQYHMIATTNTNKVYVWGWNNNRQLGDGTTTQRNEPLDITSFFSFGVGESVIDVEASLSNSYVLTSTGRYFSWGSNFGGSVGNNSTTLVSTVTDHTAFMTLGVNEMLVDIQSNDATVLAMSNTGNLYGWGSNYAGALFTGDNTDRLTNTLLTGAFLLDIGEYFTAFSTGDDFSVVATSNGEVYSAGNNTIGQLGDSTIAQRNTPTLISGSMNLADGEYVTHIESYLHTIVSTNQNRVFGWGWNRGECIGDDIGIYVYSPYEITSALNLSEEEEIAGISASSGNSYVLTNNNDYYSWGTNGYGKFMFGYYEVNLSPVPLKGPKNFDIIKIKEYLVPHVELISSTYRHTVVKTESEQIYVWGFNLDGALGTGDKENRIVPYEITNSLNLGVTETVTMIVTGDIHTVFLTSDNRVLGVGSNYYGNLGTGDTVERLNPYDITDQIPLNPTEYIVKIFAGGYNTFLLSNEGNVFAMGRSSEGQLTNMNPINHTPTNITSNLLLEPGESVEDIYVGYKHTLVHTSNDRLLAFGDNAYGQLGNGTNISTYIPVEVHLDTCYNTTVSNILDIGIGNNHAVLLSDNNDVCSWGINENGELGEGGSVNRNEPFQINNQFVKDINESFTKVSVGKKHNFVLTDYGNTYSWGDAFSGMLATGSDIDQKFPGDVSANIDTRSDTLKEYVLGYSHSYAWTEEGSLYGVGSNYAGYLGLGQVPSTYSMLNITKSIDDLSLIKFLYLPEQYVGSSKIYLKIYPEYNIFDNLESIRINGIDRDLNYLEGENGEITFSIDHTNIVGDTISMEVDGFTYADGYVQATGATYAEAEMSVDYEDPTFDVTSSMTMPIGSAEIDWTTLANNIEDNSFGPITLFSIDDVNYSVVGEYSVTITATDESGNSTSHSFPVMIVDNYGPVIEYTGPTIFEAGSEYNLLTGLSAIDSYDGDITEDVDITDGIDIGIVGNYQVEYFVSDSSGNTDTLIVDVEVVDTTSPTFDDPLDVGPIGVGVLGNEDWTSQIVNLSDNSTDTMITGFTDDIDYTMPGMYTVSVWAEDTSGNRTTKQFNVELVDNAPPTIDILQDITIGLGESIEITTYFTATDLIDGDVTNLITLDDSGVNYNLVGVYSLIVYAYDLSMNQQQIIVEVHINDVVDPSFNVIEELDLELGDETEYDWLTLVTNLSDDSGITPDLMIVHDDVDFTTIGTFSVGIKATDEAGNFTEEYIIVTIVDTTAPVVELKSGIDTLFVGEEHIDGGITIDELTDYTMTSESTINADDPGSYTITYLVVDESLNETEIIRHVTVLEKNPEVEFELGAGFTSLDIGDTLNTPTCTFRFDGNPVPCVFDSAGVDMSAAGTYTFTASANYQGETYSREIYVWVWDFDVKQSSPIGYWKREEEVML